MPINAHPDYLAAEQKYLLAKTKEQKIMALKEMISHAPSHKGAENLRAQLKKRLAKLKYTKEKEEKKRKSIRAGIKKEDMQAVIIGETSIGKSRLLTTLTNATPKIAETPFERYTTTKPEIGMMNYQGCQIQLIENPAIESEYYDKGLTNSADTIIILFAGFTQLERIEQEIQNSKGKKIVVFMDNLNVPSEQIRKIRARLESKKYNFAIINLKIKEGIEELKSKIFQSFNKIRIYTKEPGKEPDKKKPLILKPNSVVRHVAKKIIRNLENLKETKIWGPSSKFPGQVIGLNHKLKDLDIVEFKTK